MKLSIIIVSWNVSDLLCRLLDSIFHYTDGIDYEVIVIDNQSKDGTYIKLQNKFRNWVSNKKLIIKYNDFNAGFSKANNQGLNLAKGKYVLFMNPDMELIENSLQKLIEFYDKTPKLGAVTCRLLYGDKTVQPNIKSFPNLCSQILVLLKMHHFFSWLPCLKKYLNRNFDYSKYAYVEQIMGAFTLTKKDIIKEIGGWNESYWLWWEDVELCKNIRDAGYDIIYNPLTEVIHYEGKSFEQTKGIKKQKRFNKGMLTYFKNHHSKLAVLCLYLLQPVSIFLAFLSGSLKIKGRAQSKLSK